MADTTTKKAPGGHAGAVKAVKGDVDPEVVPTTHELPVERKKDEKLDKETGGAAAPFTASIDDPKERKVRAKRTLANGKTEAVLEEAPATPVFPPDDGGYNPEKRTHAGPDGTKVPSAVGKNVTGSADNADLTTAGWKDRDIKS